MGVGNQQLWNQGIGAPATNMLMDSVSQPTVSNRHNFNQALSGSNDPAQPVTTATPVSPDQPAQPAMSGSSPAMSGGQQQQQQTIHPMLKAKKNAFDQAMLMYQQAQQALSGNNDPYAKHAGMSLANWQRKFFEAQQQYQLAQQTYGG